MNQTRILVAFAFLACAMGGALLVGARFFPALPAMVGIRPALPTVAVATRLVSRTADGTPATSPSLNPTLSADGQTLIFVSAADNLVANDPKNEVDFFRYDAAANRLTWVQVGTGEAVDSWVQLPALSATGNGFTFASRATNLVPNDPNGIRDLFWHNLTTGETTLVSKTNTGAPATAERNFGGGPAWGSMESAVSADGQWILFTSTATNLAPAMPCTYTVADLNACTHAYLQNRATGETVRLSTPRFCPLTDTPCDPATDPAFATATGTVDALAISADGRYAAFDSKWEGLTPDDTVRNCLPRNYEADTASPCADLFLYDRADESLTLISRLPDGTQIEDNITDFSMSADGQQFVMEVGFTNLYLYDHTTATTRAVPLPNGYRGNNPVLSGDGTVLILTVVWQDEKVGILRYHPASNTLAMLELPYLPVNIAPYALNHDGTVLAAVLADGRGDQGSGSNENLYWISLPPP